MKNLLDTVVTNFLEETATRAAPVKPAYRQVDDRMVEHQRDVNNHKTTSKVFEHVDSTGHQFDFANVSILDQCNHKKVRLHLESIHTHIQSNSINRSLIMDNAYRPLFWIIYYVFIILTNNCIYTDNQHALNLIIRIFQFFSYVSYHPFSIYSCNYFARETLHWWSLMII